MFINLIIDRIERPAAALPALHSLKGEGGTPETSISAKPHTVILF